MSDVIIDDIESANELVVRSGVGAKFVFKNCGVIPSGLIELAKSKAKTLEFHGDCKIEDLSVLNSSSLEELVIDSYVQNSFNGELDGGTLKSIRSISLSGLSGSNILSFGECKNLEILILQDMDISKSNILSDLQTLKKLSLTNIKMNPTEIIGSIALEEVHLNNVRLENLVFLQVAEKIQFLSLARMRGLKSISGVECLPQLEQFIMQSMTNIGDLSPLSKATNLKILQLVDVGEVDSLSFLASAENIERFLFIGDKARVKDLDFSWLATMKKLRYAKIRDRRGYSHKSSDFPKD